MKTFGQTVILAAAMLLQACSSESASPPPSYPVEIRMGTLLPADGMVGTFHVTIEKGFLSFSDFAIYGAYRDSAVATFLIDGPILAHAGHQHGTADLTGEVDGNFALDLTREPALLATLDLTEGHYFDGRIRLVHADETSLLLPDKSPLDDKNPLYGHTFYLKGSATDGQGSVDFELTVDAEATVPGLAYARTVTETGSKEIVTRLDLGAVLDGVDFRSLSQDGALVVDSEHHADTYLLIKARLNDPASYVQDDLEPPN